MTRARELVFNAKKALDAAKLEEAKKLYDESWDLWAGVFKKFDVVEEGTAKDDLLKHIQNYTSLLRQMDEEFPRDFPLRFLMDGSGVATPAATGQPGLPTPARITPEGAKQESGDASTESDTTEPKAAEPKAAEPKAAEPKAAKPETAEPKTAEPMTETPQPEAKGEPESNPSEESKKDD